MHLEADYLKSLSYTFDEAAVLRDLMTTFGQDVWQYAFFMTKNKDAADDLSQEVFLQAYKHLQSFRGHSTVKTWLLTITRNRAINYNRSAYIRKVLLVDRIISPKMTSPSAEHELFDQLETKQIWQCVMQLSSKYREPLILDAHYQMSMYEIADVLQIRIGTVKSRLSRAKAKVTAMLQQAEELTSQIVKEV
ncbi:sigma-70 family RNA polymerase sigma factor [Paenibacillus albiflavus]|uniref:Sigma-70 family RNA polymerase sigma factor n=1 Tax=Paenibacillus albiflavus TaxID=2545760 RepID=A0A4R4EPC1_9BACL|nr:sigma-70 family RNA polymerase sigma factor [Paenibacillus albiflavus]TCZ80228.1 sigma-70 family RNA polymerase sigma factor [Paenibacillus albiflavus]